MKKSTRNNRIISFVAILATVFVVLVSGLFIAQNSGHHCDDEAHCPVCNLILQSEQNIRTIGSGLIISVVAAMVVKAVAATAIHYEYQSVQTTLVSQKVRLDS